jgi:uncharacterized protein
VIDYFKNSYSRIYLFGHSLGAMLSLIAARDHVAGVIAIAAPMHPEKFEERLSPQQREEIRSVGFTTWIVKKPIADIPYTITEQFITGMRQQKPLDAAKSMTCPVLIVQGTADKVVTTADAEELSSVAQHKDILLIGGADHNITNPEHLDTLIAGVIEWLRKQKV